MKKVTKQISATAMSIGLMCSIAPVAVFAAGDPNGSYWIHIKETGTWYNDLIRSAFWAILKFMASIINCIERAVKEVLSWNIYSKLKEAVPSIDDSNIKKVAIVIFTVAVIFAGILLIINGDRMQIKDTVKNILIAMCLIVGFPALMSALDNFTNDYTKNYEISAEAPSSEGTKILLGDKVLAAQVYDNVASVQTGTQKYLSDDAKFRANKNSPTDLDINKLATQKEIDRKYLSSSTNRVQRKFSELTMNNCVSLLGMSSEYGTLTRVKGLFKPDEKFPYRNRDAGIRDGDYTVEEYEQMLINILLNKQFDNGRIRVRDAKNIDLVRKAKTFEEAVDAIKEDIIWQLNYENNIEIASGNDIKVVTQSLRTLEEYKKMGWIDQAIKVDIWENSEEERVYAYDYDFFGSFIDMIIIIICLLFALLKLCRMMWEIAFMHIFVPLVIATDAHGNGRAKRAVQQLITTIAVLVVVLITLSLYISLISRLHEISNLIARWGLILAGMYFVVDGSDFVVKMTGMDAGVKSGAATLLGLRSAAGIAQGLGHTASGVARTGAHVAQTGAGVANHVAGAAVGATVGAVSGAAGGVSTGGDGHSSIAGAAVGSAAGATTGAIGGAARGGAEGAHRGLTGLFRSNNNEQQPLQSNSQGGSQNGSLGSKDSSISETNIGSASASAGTAGTITSAAGSVSDDRGAMIGGTVGTTQDIADSNSDVALETVSAPPTQDDPGDVMDREREGSIFTRSFSAGAAVGSVAGHPIKTANNAKEKATSALDKLSDKDNRREIKTTAKAKVRSRVDDFIKGKYKDNNKDDGGNS